MDPLEHPPVRVANPEESSNDESLVRRRSAAFYSHMIRGEECWITLTRIEGAQPRVLAHEFLHHWLWEEIGVEASCKLDNFEYEESPTGWVDDGGLILAPFEALRDRMGELMERLDLDEDVLDMSDRDVGDREPLLES